MLEIGSCTLSIIMLDWFNTKPYTLPGRTRRPYAEYDTATFKSIYAAARLIETDCLEPTRRPGWESVGAKSNIGVFLWATDSEINGQVMGRLGAANPVVFTNASVSKDVDSMTR